MDDGNTKTPKEDIENVHLQYHAFLNELILQQQSRFVPPSYINHVLIGEIAYCTLLFFDRNVLRMNKETRVALYQASV